MIVRNSFILTMRMENHSYHTRPIQTTSDLGDMIHLALLSPQDNFRCFDLPYRLCSWALDSAENGNLWFQDDQLIAWAILQSPFWALDICIHPDLEKVLAPIILKWVDQKAPALLCTHFGRPSWYVQTFSDQIERIHALEGAGYRNHIHEGEDSWIKLLMQRSNHPIGKKYPPPPGFTVRPLLGELEVPAYVDLHQTVFGSKNMTIEWRSRMLNLPQYQPDLDIVVEAPEGTLAAFCIGWMILDDQSELHGQIEPLGCHPNFRQFALGRVALSEVLERLVNKGAKYIWVETDNYRNTAFRLYRSFDFDVIREVFIFRKDFSS
jgi:ribosomal protein S18 acetylase RimI-like enzyme